MSFYPADPARKHLKSVSVDGRQIEVELFFPPVDVATQVDTRYGSIEGIHQLRGRFKPKTLDKDICFRDDAEIVEEVDGKKVKMTACTYGPDSLGIISYGSNGDWEEVE